jgi:hypothetical protein
MSDYDVERIAELLGRLPPAPRGWVEAASELPRARAGIDELAERARRDLAFREVLLADLETALAREGVEPRPALIDLLRRRVAE